MNTSHLCSGSLHPKAVEGISMFNEGKYFEAHEALETAWREETGMLRELYRGILQVGVAYYHLQRGNCVGAIKMLDKADRCLQPFPDVCCSVHVAPLRADAARVKGELLRLGPSRLHLFNQALIKAIRLDRSQR